MGQTTAARPAPGNAEGYPGVEHTEETANSTIAEDCLHHFVRTQAGAQTVTVSQAEKLARMLDHQGLVDDFDSHGLQIGIHPHIVIAGTDKDLHPGLEKVHQSGENPDISLRNHVSILVPEIPDVAKQIQRLGPLHRNPPQETHETSLPFDRISDFESQMNVGCKKDQIPTVHKLKELGNDDCCTDKSAIECEPLEFGALDKGNHYLAGKKPGQEGCSKAQKQWQQLNLRSRKITAHKVQEGLSQNRNEDHQEGELCHDLTFHTAEQTRTDGGS